MEIFVTEIIFLLFDSKCQRICLKIVPLNIFPKFKNSVTEKQSNELLKFLKKGQKTTFQNTSLSLFFFLIIIHFQSSKSNTHFTEFPYLFNMHFCKIPNIYHIGLIYIIEKTFRATFTRNIV